MESSKKNNDINLDKIKLFIATLKNKLDSRREVANHARLRTLLVNFIGYLKLLQKNETNGAYGQSIAKAIDILIKDKILEEDASIFAKDINQQGLALAKALAEDSDRTNNFFLLITDQLSEIAPDSNKKPQAKKPIPFNLKNLELGITLMTVLYARELADSEIEDGDLIYQQAVNVTDPNKKNTLVEQAISKYRNALSAIANIPISHQIENDVITKINALKLLINLLISSSQQNEVVKYLEQLLQIRNDLHNNVNTLIPEDDTDIDQIYRNLSIVKYNNFVATDSPNELIVGIAYRNNVPNKTYDDYLWIIEHHILLFEIFSANEIQKASEHYNLALLQLSSAELKYPEKKDELKARKEEIRANHDIKLILDAVGDLYNPTEDLYRNEDYLPVVKNLEEAYDLIIQSEQTLPNAYNIPYVLNAHKKIVVEKLIPTYIQLISIYLENKPELSINYINKINKLFDENTNLNLPKAIGLGFYTTSAYLNLATQLEDKDPVAAYEYLEIALKYVTKVTPRVLALDLEVQIDRKMEQLKDKVDRVESSKRSQTFFTEKFGHPDKDGKSEESPRPGRK